MTNHNPQPPRTRYELRQSSEAGPDAEDAEGTPHGTPLDPRRALRSFVGPRQPRARGARGGRVRRFCLLRSENLASRTLSSLCLLIVCSPRSMWLHLCRSWVPNDNIVDRNHAAFASTATRTSSPTCGHPMLQCPACRISRIGRAWPLCRPSAQRAHRRRDHRAATAREPARRRHR